MNFDLKERTILLTLAGSRAYGMSQPTSDVDVKGVAIAPPEYAMGFLHNFEQADKKSHMMTFVPYLKGEEIDKAKEGELEGSVYDIRKFFKLAADNNPNILDALFCRDEDIRFIHPLGKELRANAHLFLSKKARFTFFGYAIAQLKRINTHRDWLLNPPKGAPIRSDYGLPERTLIPADQLQAAQAAVRKKIDSWEIDFDELSEATKIYIYEQLEEYMVELSIFSDEKFQAAGRAIGYDENFIELLDRERRYKAASRKWKQYNEWKRNRNTERAALEKKYGFDLKHGSHLTRLMRMCEEILETGQVNVYRPDAEELLAIRSGEWSYDDLMEFYEGKKTRIDELYEKCTILPHKPNREKLNDLCIKIVGEFK